MCVSAFSLRTAIGLLKFQKKTIKANKHPHLEQNNINEVIAKIKGFEEGLKEFRESINLQIEEAEKEINSVKVKDDDDVLKAINKHFSVGSGYSFEQIMEITKEGKHRYEFRIPPGYGDYYKKEKKHTNIS
ncbi:PIN-like domain-containing protein [Chryseobacterium arthrosphaerae]